MIVRSTAVRVGQRFLGRPKVSRQRAGLWLRVACCWCIWCLATPALASENALADVLQAALRNNPLLHERAAMSQMARAELQESKSERLPSFSAQAGRMNRGGNTAQLQLRQPLWAFGRIDSNIDWSDARVAVRQLEEFSQARVLVEQAAVFYNHMVGLQDRIQVAQENVAEHERLLSMIRSRLRGGLAAAADEQLAISRLTMAQALVSQLNGELDNVRNELYALAHVDVEQARAGDVSRYGQALEPELQAQAVQGDTEVLLKQMELLMAQRNIDRVRTATHPTVSAQLTHTRNQAGFTPQTEFRVGITLEANLDGMGQGSRHRTQAATQAATAASEALESARQQAQRRVAVLLREQQTQQQLLVSHESTKVAVEGILASYLRQFDAGHKSWLDVLNVQREFSDIRQQVAVTASSLREQALRLTVMAGSLDEMLGIVAS